MKILAAVLLLSLALAKEVQSVEGYEGQFLAECDTGKDNCFWYEVSFDDYYSKYLGLENSPAKSLQLIRDDHVSSTYYTTHESEWWCFDNMKKCDCFDHVEGTQHCEPQDEAHLNDPSKPDLTPKEDEDLKHIDEPAKKPEPKKEAPKKPDAIKIGTAPTPREPWHHKPQGSI